MEPRLELVMKRLPVISKSGRTLFAAVAVLSLALGACDRNELERGRINLSLGDYPMAIRFFQASVEKNPQLYDGRLGLGQALLQKAFAENDSAAFGYALVQLEACRSLSPSQDLSEILTDAYYERARSQLKNQDTVAALSSLSKAIDRGPTNPKPFNLVGIVYGKLGESEKAEALFRKALLLDSMDASANFNLGMIDWQAGETRLAHGHWLKALTALPHDEDVLYWFALSEKKLRENP
ncbi:MAG: putative lipoprotein [Fibrobacteres bacterium]|nr:putative lipoprotein [Fibrobacterota bacterium]